MVIEKIQNHMASNKDALKQINNIWMGRLSSEPMSRDSLDRISKMENKAVGYVARFGDKSMLTKKMSQDIKSEEHLFLLVSLGMAIDKRDVIVKAMESSGKKNKWEKTYLKDQQEESEKEIKEWLIKIDSYHLNKRLTEKDTDNLDVEQEFNHKNEVARNPIVEKGLSLKMNPIVLVKLQKKPQMNLGRKLAVELDDDFDFNLEDTEIYTGFLDEERIQQEIELVARKEFHLKEVASTQRASSLDGDIPRAVVTDLSFAAINNVVNSIDQRFNQAPMLEKKKTPKKKTASASVTPINSAPKPFSLKMNKPTPDKMKNLQGKSAKQLAMAIRAEQKTMEISKKFMYGQENHMNYIDIERFELDEMQGRSSVYEAGAKNPLTGRIISSRLKNQFSDLRMDNSFKIRR